MNHQTAGIQKRISEPVYPGDILADTQLQMCSLETRGAWFECLLRMWRDKTYQISGSHEALARLLGCPIDTIKRVISELETTNTCDVTGCNGTVTLVSRRLKRRSKERISTANRVRKHRVKHESNDPVTTKKGVPSSSVSSSSSISTVVKKTYVDWEDVKTKWNALASEYGITTLQRMSDSRKAKYRTRLRTNPDFWQILEREIPLLSEFVREKSWFCFEWCIKSENNLLKLSEGNYRDRQQEMEYVR